MFPAERINAIVDLVPETCRQCQHGLRTCDDLGDPRRHQVTELPPIEAHITEYRCHRLRCPAYGKTTQALLSLEVVGQFGPIAASTSGAPTTFNVKFRNIPVQ